MTSSIAGRLTGGSCMPYSVTKAAQLHLMKCLAATQGPKVRVNAVLPGLLLTEWASGMLRLYEKNVLIVY
jgi:NAD(P)-dependent dehydrogenase (short-subunit alcohol dehydrogenase family)